jgi:3-phenylpropionate/trans-cinnamate dioxygenase ferredoxin subunit
MKGEEHYLICKSNELAIGEARRFDIAGHAICVARCNDGFRAISDTCSHEAYSLAEGEVDPEECSIECWKHGSFFSLVTGEPLTLPATRPVATYAVVVDGDNVIVKIR